MWASACVAALCAAIGMAPQSTPGADGSAPTAAAEHTVVRSVIAAGNDDHLWFVLRRGSLSASLGHVAEGMVPGEFQPGLPLHGPPTALGAWGDQAALLFPARSAVMPRPYLLSTSARRNPASGLWISVPTNRLELRPALPSSAEVESLIVDSSGPLVLFVGEEKLWKLQREQWIAIELPATLAQATGRRLEPVARGPSILAPTGEHASWERWRSEDSSWLRFPLGLGSARQITPVGGPALMALVEDETDAGAVRRRIMSLPDDGAITLATLDDSMPQGAALAWFAGAPVLIDGAEGQPRMRRVDPVSGAIGEPTTLTPQRSLAAAWGHLPILAAIVISLLMVVFFVRSLRDEGEQRMPEGWEPLPFGWRLVALGIDLIPGVLLTKFILGAPWSSFVAVPWLVIESEAALPTLVAPILTVVIAGTSEAILGSSLGKRLVGGRVVSMRPTTDAIDATASQTLARNLFKVVVLQMQLLAIFTLIHPLGQGVGETVSATAVVRRRSVSPEPVEA